MPMPKAFGCEGADVVVPPPGQLSLLGVICATTISTTVFIFWARTIRIGGTSGIVRARTIRTTIRIAIQYPKSSTQFAFLTLSKRSEITL